MGFSNADKDFVWDKAQTIRGKDPELYRKDPCGNEIYKPSYGKQGEKSWVMDHKVPLDKGGTESRRNLQAMQTKANLEKGAKHQHSDQRKKR